MNDDNYDDDDDGFALKNIFETEMSLSFISELRCYAIPFILDSTSHYHNKIGREGGMYGRRPSLEKFTMHCCLLCKKI